MVDSGEVIEEITRYRDKPGARVLDLRKEGVPFVAVLSRRECRNTVAGPHLHIHPGGIEIVYCVRGILSFRTPQREYAFLPRNIFVSRPDEPHCMVTNPKGLFVYRILVELPPQGKALAGLSLDESGWLLDRLRTLPRLYAVQDRSIRSAFERCFSVYDAPSRVPGRRSFTLRQAVYDLLLACIAAAEGNLAEPEHPDVSQWVRKMETDPLADYSLAEMSRSSGVSPNVFSAMFKITAGLPPQSYLRVCRIRMAEVWLAQGKMSIAAIADRLKFCSAQYFATVFKEIAGMTPLAWRKNGTKGRCGNIGPHTEQQRHRPKGSRPV